MRDERDGHKMFIVDSFFLASMMQSMSGRDLYDKELARYREPYRTQASRKPASVCPQQVPFAGGTSDTHAELHAYSQRLEKTELAKLHLWAKPGAIIKPSQAKRSKKRMKKLSTVFDASGHSTGRSRLGVR